MPTVTERQSVWNVSQCRSKKGVEALIVNGRGSKSKMIASLSLAEAGAAEEAK